MRDEQQMPWNEEQSVKTSKPVKKEEQMPWDDEPVIEQYRNYNKKRDLDNLIEYQVQAEYIEGQSDQQTFNEPSNPIQEMLQNPGYPRPSQRNKSKPKKKSRA